MNFEQMPQKSAEEIEKEEEAKYEEDKKRGYKIVSGRKISPEVEKEARDYLKKEKTKKEAKSEIETLKERRERGELLSQSETATLRSEEIAEKIKREEKQKQEEIAEAKKIDESLQDLHEEINKIGKKKPWWRKILG